MNESNALELEQRLREKLPELERLLVRMGGHWTYEDSIYRYYHTSFKVYFVQALTLEIVEALRSLAPGRALNPRFMTIYGEGTGKHFDLAHNREWDKHTRPQLEAFFHAKFFLEMAVKYGKELRAETALPSGWAAFLYLYDLR